MQKDEFRYIEEMSVDVNVDMIEEALESRSRLEDYHPPINNKLMHKGGGK